MLAEYPPNAMNKRIRRARLMMGLTQGDFAQRVGVSTRTIEYWESGSTERLPKARNLGRLAAATGLPITWFFGAS